MTEELKKEILNILDNVYYWETCPQEYNDRIDVVKKQLILTSVSKSDCTHDAYETYEDAVIECKKCHELIKDNKTVY
jgi:hypothetical protein